MNMEFNKIIIEDILNTYIYKYVSINNFIDSFEKGLRGHLYASVFELIHRANCIPFLKGYTLFYESTGKLKSKGMETKSVRDFINDKISNNSDTQRKTDLLYFNKDTRHIIAIRSKYDVTGNKAKYIKYYKIEDMQKDLDKKFKSYKKSYGVLTNCSSIDLKNKINKASYEIKRDLKYIIANPSIDIYFQNFLNFVRSCKTLEGVILSFKDNCGEIHSEIKLRYYQEYAYKKIESIFNKENTALIRTLPHFGKTFVFGKLMTNYKNILYICSDNSNIKELIKLKDFNIYIKDVYEEESNITLDEKKNNIIIISNQTMYNKDTIFPKFDLIISDESNIRGNSETFSNIYASAKSSNREVKLLLVTDTFKIPQSFFDLKQEQIFTFGILELCKIKNRDSVIIKDIEKTIQKLLSEEELDEIKYPKINHYSIDVSNNMDEQTRLYETTQNNVNTFNDAFKCNEQGFFTSEGESQIINVFDRVFRRKDVRVGGMLLSKIITETKLIDFNNKLIICYVPGGNAEMTSGNVCKNINKLFKDNYEERLYKTMVAPSENIKEEIEKQLEEDKILIVFSDKRLQPAIKLERCIGVIFFDDSKSHDSYIQNMYIPVTRHKRKNEVFVLDCNPARINEAMMMEYDFNTKQIKDDNDLNYDKFFKLIQNIICIKRCDFIQRSNRILIEIIIRDNFI